MPRRESEKHGRHYHESFPVMVAISSDGIAVGVLTNLRPVGDPDGVCLGRVFTGGTPDESEFAQAGLSKRKVSVGLSDVDWSKSRWQPSGSAWRYSKPTRH